MLWQLRPPTDQDVSFVFNSWLKSFRQAPAMANISNTVYFKEAHAQIEKVIQSPGCRAVVACDPSPGSENVIYGYGVGEIVDSEFIIHWIYVKHPFRGFGVGKAIEAELLKTPHETVSFSCYSNLSNALTKSRKYTYNPFKFWSKQ